MTSTSSHEKIRTAAFETVRFPMTALEEEYVDPEALPAIRRALTPWDAAESGDYVGIRREIRLRRDEIFLDPGFGVLERRGDKVRELVYQTIPEERRTLLADAILMSAFGATSCFLHGRINRAAGGTIPRVCELEMIYLADALLVQPSMPVHYHHDHVALIDKIPLQQSATAGYGTIILMPAPSEHERLRQWQAADNARALYSAHCGIGLLSEAATLVPLRPLAIDHAA